MKEKINYPFVFVKGILIAIAPSIVIRFIEFVTRPSKDYLILKITKFMIPEAIYLSIFGLIVTGIYLFLRNKNPKTAKKVMIVLVSIYYIICLIYLSLILYFKFVVGPFYYK